MEDLKHLQDLKNKKIEELEELKEKLQELDLNHKVSFDEYDTEEPLEKTIKQRKKSKKKIECS